MYGKYSKTGHVNAAQSETNCCISLETTPSAVFFIHVSIDDASSVTLYFLVVFFNAFILNTQVSVIRLSHTISSRTNC